MKVVYVGKLTVEAEKSKRDEEIREIERGRVGVGVNKCWKCT